MTKKTVIIAGFPGVGKSSVLRMYKESPNFLVKDSDSSQYEKNAFWTKKYVEDIRSCIGKYDLVLVSTHAEVLQELKNQLVDFWVAIPDSSRKEEFMRNYKQRGNTSQFIDTLSKNWDLWLTALDQDDQLKKLKLPKNWYLSDIISPKSLRVFNIIKF